MNVYLNGKNNKSLRRLALVNFWECNWRSKLKSVHKSIICRGNESMRKGELL